MRDVSGDHTYRVIGSTTSLCPARMRPVPAEIIEKGGSIWLLKKCPVHGEQTELLEKNAAYYLARGEYDKPGTPTPVQTACDRGCPFDCGLCPAHDQHTCIALIEITEDCDLHCPTCYAESRPGSTLALGTIERMMDFYQEAEGGKAEVLQISGGEPATHPQVLEILKLGRSKNFKCVMLNTNGLRIAQDDEFVDALAEFAGGFEVYLQFDGFDAATYHRLRGRDISALKLQAVDRLVRREVPLTLVATIEKGVNDREIGRIIEFAMGTPCVRGVNFQPLAFFGRFNGPPPGERTTLTEILEKAEEQTGGAVKMSDFIPLPCNVERVAITYFYRSDGGFTPITRKMDARKYLPFIPNTFAFDADDFIAETRKAALASPQGLCQCMIKFLDDLRPLIPAAYERQTEDEKRRYVSENTFRISVSSFVDAYNFDARSMQKECVHVLTPDLRRVPFSAYNMVHRYHAEDRRAVCCVGA